MQMSFKKIIFRTMICLYERSDNVMSLENYYPGSDAIKNFNYCVNNPYYYFHLWVKDNMIDAKRSGIRRKRTYNDI